MTAVLPVPPGGSNLTAWLNVAHNADGSLAPVNGSLVMINVKDPKYGATGNGTTDDTAAINAAINAATGSLAPASYTRTPVSPVYLPPGTYKVTSDLNIQSVSGFRLVGAGIAQTLIYASGTGFTQAALFVNGSADGIFEGFSLQGDGTEQMPNGIRLDWVTASRTDAGCVTNSTTTVANTLAQAYDVGATITGSGIPGGTTVVSSTAGVGWTLSASATASATVSLTVASVNAANRSTTGNKFRDIRIRALRAATMFSLEANSNVQCDGTFLDNVIVTGTQTPGSWSSSGNWQKGFAVGNGTYANNYDHKFARCDAADLYYGWYVNASGVSIDNTQPGGNFCDFWVKPGAQVTITNVQSQNSGQVLIMAAAQIPYPVSLNDAYFVTVYPSNSNQMVTQNGGNLAVNGLYGWVYASSAYQTPLISINNYSGKRAYATLKNISLNGTAQAAIVPQASYSDVLVLNYQNYNPGTGVTAAVIAGDMMSYYTGTSWKIPDAPTAAVLTPSFASGTAAQLSDLTQDYLVYLEIGTAGTAFTLSIGPTSGVANAIVTSGVATSGTLYSVRLPAWYLKWSATTATLANQAAIGC